MKNLAIALMLLLPIGCTPQPPVVPPSPPTEPDPLDEKLDTNAKLLQIHNDNRSTPLTQNRELTVAAQKHANWMAANRRMSHRGEGGSSPGTRIKAAGYGWSTYGENVAYGQPTPEDVMRVWLNSPGHRRNIKSSAYADVGFGSATASTGQIYWCVTFGSRGFGADEWIESQAAPEFEDDSRLQTLTTWMLKQGYSLTHDAKRDPQSYIVVTANGREIATGTSYEQAVENAMQKDNEQ